MMRQKPARYHPRFSHVSAPNLLRSMGARPSFAFGAPRHEHVRLPTHNDQFRDVRACPEPSQQVWCATRHGGARDLPLYAQWMAPNVDSSATLGLVPIRRNRFGVLKRQTPPIRQRRSGFSRPVATGLVSYSPRRSTRPPLARQT